MPGRFRAHETERTPIRYACSFCGKNQEQVRRLIAGPGSVFICDECVSLCQEIISEEFGGSQPAQQPTASAESQPAISGKPELHAPTPTPCPECKSGRLLAEAANNVRLVALDSGLRGGFSAHTELWAIVCPNCGHTTLYAKKPDKLTR